MSNPELFKMTTQSNDLIESILTGDLTIQEYKLFQLILAKIPLKPHIKLKSNGSKVTQWRTNLLPDTHIEITAKEFSKVFSVKLYDCYDRLKVATDRLHNTKVKFQYAKYDDVFHLFKKIRYYKDGTQRVGAIFHDDLIPHLSKLKDNLTTIQIEHIKKFKSAYSYRFYSLLKMYFGKYGKRKRYGKLTVTCNLNHLREFFCLDEYDAKGNIINAKYTSWSDLKTRVINASIKDINAYSDLKVELVPVKRGRQKVTEFELVISEKCHELKASKSAIKVKKPVRDVDAYNKNIGNLRAALGKTFNQV